MKKSFGEQIVDSFLFCMFLPLFVCFENGVTILREELGR